MQHVFSVASVMKYRKDKYKEKEAANTNKTFSHGRNCEQIKTFFGHLFRHET